MKNTTHPKSTPYQVFLHLMMMTMYYTVIISFVSLAVQYIDLLFPDQLIGYTGYYDVIRSSSSVLIVSFPVFLLSSWFIRKAFKTEPDERHIAIRRWLVYLTLFLAGIAMVVDLVQFVNGFYSGELTLPFFFKLLTVLIVSLLTFAYFLWDLSEKGISSKNARILAGVSSGFLIVTLGVGFALAGTPGHQRAVRFDEQRVSSLSSIEYEIGNYWREKGALPAQLSDMQRDLYYFQVPVDPETGAAFTYEVTGDLTFQLCADFSTEYQSVPVNSTSLSFPSMDQWAHPKGTTCFDRTLDPDFFDGVIKQ